MLNNETQRMPPDYAPPLVEEMAGRFEIGARSPVEAILIAGVCLIAGIAPLVIALAMALVQGRCW